MKRQVAYLLMKAACHLMDTANGLLSADMPVGFLRRQQLLSIYNTLSPLDQQGMVRELASFKARRDEEPLRVKAERDRLSKAEREQRSEIWQQEHRNRLPADIRVLFMQRGWGDVREFAQSQGYQTRCVENVINRFWGNATNKNRLSPAQKKVYDRLCELISNPNE
jgi:hypothetical protein